MNELQYRQLIDMLGVPCTFKQAKPPQVQIAIPKVGLASPKVTDPIVNAYGVGSRVVTIAAASLPGLAPEKFDSVLIQAERLVFEAVIPAHEPGTGKVIGWRCIVKGK